MGSLRLSAPDREEAEKVPAVHSGAKKTDRLVRVLARAQVDAGYLEL